MMSTPMNAGFLLLAVAAVTSCGILTGPRVCTDEAVAGIRVDVRDSVTNAPITEGVRVIARTETFADTAQGPFYALAFEQPGTYEVTAEAEGYRLWSRSGVRVTRGECHVRTVSLTARLQR